MKKERLIVTLLLLLSVLLIPIRSNAAENESEETEVSDAYNLVIEGGFGSNGHLKERYEFVDTEIPIFAYYYNADHTSAYIGVFENGDVRMTSRADLASGLLDYYKYDYWYYNGDSITRHDVYATDGTHRTSAVTPLSVSFTVPEDITEIEGYLFDSLESARAYFTSGDDSGVLNAPEKVYDFNTAHNFKNDVYTADIPVPHLTHLSYYGFEVDNAKAGRYLDMYVTSQFYGVKHDKSAEYSYSIDSSNLVNSHRYNFTISDAAYDGYLVNIEDMYGVSLLDDLTEDFKSWSSAHPSHKTLSDYSFISHMAGFWESNYLGHHTYANNVYTSDRDKTNYSNQAVVTYYVRFYQVIDGELKYGRWASYSYSRSSPTVTNLSIGDVEATETGEPVQVNAYSGMQDSAGNFSFHNPSSDSSTGSSMLDAADLWATINGLVSGMGSIPDLLHAVFIFMPSWLLKMISAGIAAIIVLRFVGR